VRVKENTGMPAEYTMEQVTNQSQFPVVYPAEKQFTYCIGFVFLWYKYKEYYLLVSDDMLFGRNLLTF
jgi:hypothetical protein